MRIAIDGRELIGRPTGVGRYLRELLTAWQDVAAAADHEFVLCSPEQIDPAPYRRLRLSSVTVPGSGTLWEQRQLPKLVAAAKADVLLSPAYTCPLWCPVPIVLVIHDVSFAAHPEWFPWREGLRRRTLTRLGARRAARVITDAEFSKREVSNFLDVPSSRIEVIYLGASALHVAPDGQPRDPLVLYVGSLFNRRHIPELIEGFQQLAARIPEARLEIVGDNRTSPRIDPDELIASSGTSDRVRWRSYIQDAELASLYGSASAFAFLSDYEGFGLTPVEAMAGGVPVVVLDTPIAREIYGSAAVYIQRPEPTLIADALARVLAPSHERAEFIAAGMRQVQRYSWRNCAERTLQVLLSAR